jgi:hypothetical protein
MPASTLVLSSAALASMFVLASARPALAQAPWWHISSETVPAHLPPDGRGQLLVVVSNLGDEPVDGGQEPVVISDKLPPGLVATGVSSSLKNGVAVTCSLAAVECSFKGLLYPYEEITVAISVEVEASADTLSDEASVRGGGAARTTRTLMIPVGAEAGFGIENYELSPFNENGSPASQAAAHPFQLTTTLAFNQVFISGGVGRQPVALPKDLSFHLPPGLVGNPNAAGQCTMANFFALVLETNLCSPSTVVGVATVTADEPKTLRVFSRTVPVFNLVPAQGEPARFGLEVAGKIPVVIDTSVRSGRDYGVDVSVKDATETAGLLSTQVTFWGVPGDPRHDNARGWECVAGGALAKQVGESCPAKSELPQEPFLTLPGVCAANPPTEPVLSSLQADSWADPGSFLGAEYAWMNEGGQLLGFEGCGELPFSPTIDVIPEEHTAATPTGLSVDVKAPQQSTLEAGKLAEADLRDTAVTLPEGVQLNPSAANGLEGCTEAQVGFTGINRVSQTDEYSTQPASCPDGSKVGSARITTPLLSHPLEGAIYLARQNENPFGSLIALYLVAEDPVSGTRVKLAGEATLDLLTGQLRASFENAPQLPFESLELHFFGGDRAPLATPAHCGSFTARAIFAPWSGEEAQNASSTFAITSGLGGGVCPPSLLPFSPSLKAGMVDGDGGAFSTLITTIGSQEDQPDMRSVTLHMPPGVSGLLSSVKLCGEPEANAGSCGPESRIGEMVVSVGVGPDPLRVTGGNVFITGPYDGTGSCSVGTPGCAPFGLSIVSPVKAGPLDLERDTANSAQQPACDCVVVRAKIEVDPHTAAVAVHTDDEGPHAIPHIIDGVPVHIRRVDVLINRPGFMFNPTNCGQMQIQSSIESDQRQRAAVTVPFHAANCAALKFEPKFSVSTSGITSKADGASLRTRLSFPNVPQGTDADIAKVKVELPVQLPSRLTTLQRACTAAQFDADPAGCPTASVVGHAVLRTQLLPVPLEGPAYFVSNGGQAFPNLIMVLQGYGVRVDLVGDTFISKTGVTSSTFSTNPDVPFTSIELMLPEQANSALAANTNLCALTKSVTVQRKLTIEVRRDGRPRKRVLSRKVTEQVPAGLVMPTEMIGQNGRELRQDTPIAVTGCKAAVRVASHSVRHGTATITLIVPSAGTLAASAKGMSRAVTRTTRAGTVTVALSLSKHERHLLKRYHHRRLKAHVKITFLSVHGVRLSTTTIVLIR